VLKLFFLILIFAVHLFIIGAFAFSIGELVFEKNDKDTNQRSVIIVLLSILSFVAFRYFTMNMLPNDY